MAQQLSRSLFPELPAYPERMIQFGAGNFMRAFVDWQLQQMNRQGLFQGSAVVVQPTPGGKRMRSTGRMGYIPCCKTAFSRGKPSIPGRSSPA
ncbi:Altronate oxidoreductase [Paenibacillus sp. P1XP2]|nr:Altronate oxidoreductase [Paenibacillus sp. P1XP2]